MRHGVEKKPAIIESLRVNFQPVLLTSVTTAIGFLSMNFSDSPPFRDLGNIVAMGVMLAFFFSVTLFPALLCVLPIKVTPEAQRKGDLMATLADFVIAKKKILFPTSIAVIIGLSVFVPQNILNDNFVKYFDESVPFRQATDFMEERLSGLMTQAIQVDSNASGGINDPEYLAVLEDFNAWMRQQPETENISILSDVIKRLNKNMHADDPAYYALPGQRALAAQYLLLYELSLPYGLDLNNQIDVDKAASRIMVTTKNLNSTQNIELEKEFISRKIDLTKSQEEAFFPVLDSILILQKKIREEHHAAMRSARKKMFDSIRPSLSPDQLKKLTRFTDRRGPPPS